jgi:hypothetical protein
MTSVKRTVGWTTLAAVVALAGCATLQQLAALRNVTFSLAGVQDGALACVPLARIASYRDLTIGDIGRLSLAVTRRDVPLDIQINVGATNPADNRATATMARLAWTLLLDDRETVSGVLDTTLALPAGQTVAIPVKVRLDLYEFFGGSAESLLNLAAGLAGLNADPTRIALRATPTINTPLGPMTYPNPITIASGTVSR